MRITKAKLREIGLLLAFRALVEVVYVLFVNPVHRYSGSILQIDAVKLLESYLFILELVSKVGSIGNSGCFSFFPAKNLGAYGDGGMVVTNNDELAESVRILRVHGSKPKYYHRMVGVNSRLDALQAAILRVKLPHLDEWTAARQQVAACYDEQLDDVPGIETPYPAPDPSYIFHQYTIRVKNSRRDELRDFLKEQGIGTFVYYPLPLHLQECFKGLGYKKGDLPQSELASQEVLSLPVFPELTGEEQDCVVRAIQMFVEREGGKD